jgi:hypothetical protein
MGKFALDVAAAHRIGAARGNLSILSAMEIHADDFFATFGQAINELILRHRTDLQTKRATTADNSKLEARWLEATSTTKGPKRRWVDGTPEYAFHICGLRKLFPGALFIHLVRDVHSVVRSMLNFHRVAGSSLVGSEEQAYDYWLRAVRACLRAEEAYGPQVIHRLLYSTLINNPESAIRRLLHFVGEPYDSECLKPLAVRINSSNVPADYKADDPATNRNVVEQALQLLAEMEQTQLDQSSPDALLQIEAEFSEASLAERTQQELKDQIDRIQQHYIAEVEYYKSQIRTLQQHHINEIDGYRLQASRQRQLEEEVENHKSQLRRAHKEYIATTRKLMRMLGKVEKAATRLRDSRRWKLVNFGGVVKARLSHDEELPGYGDLDEVVATYSKWRATANADLAHKSAHKISLAKPQKASDA